MDSKKKVHVGSTGNNGVLDSREISKGRRERQVRLSTDSALL